MIFVNVIDGDKSIEIEIWHLHGVAFLSTKNQQGASRSHTTIMKTERWGGRGRDRERERGREKVKES